MARSTVARLAYLLCSALVAAAARAEVEVMTDANFAGLIKDESFLVKFYAPWCGHCKHLAPIFDRASELLAGEMKFGKVDATAQTNLKAKYDITGYPTVKFFRDGKVQDYEFPRTEEGFVSFAKRMNGPSVHRLATESKIKDFTKNDVNAVSFIFAKPEAGLDGNNDLYDNFKAVAKSLQASQIFAETRAAGWVTSFEGQDAPFIVKIEQGEAPVFYDGDATDEDELEAWVKSNQFRVLTEIDGRNFRTLSYSGRLLAIGVVNPGSKRPTEHFLGALRRLARPDSPLSDDVRSKFYFCYLDGVRWADFVTQFNIKQDQLPRVFVLNGETKTFFEDVEVDEIDEMETFLTEVVGGKVPAQREGIWGMPARWWRRFVDALPYSALLAVALLAVLLYGCCMAGDDEHAKGE